jgi:hypothetical protein
MTLGTALIVVAVLFLIDKHNLWKRAGQVVLALVALTILVGGGWFVWNIHVEKQNATNYKAAHEAVIPTPPDGSAIVPVDPYASIAQPIQQHTPAQPDYQDIACKAGAIDAKCRR